MNELLETYHFLTNRLATDPLLSLAQTVVWLDPLWQEADEDEDASPDEDGTLALALRITRRVFPEVYTQAVEKLRRGATYADLDRLICAAFAQQGIPLESLEWIGFGVPVPAYGVMLDDPDSYTMHPDIISVLECFGVSWPPDRYHVEVPEAAYTAGRLIAADLEHHTDERCRQVAWLLQWLFACSGNSSVDYDYDTLCEFQPLSWDQDDLAFAVDIITEADQIMANVERGLQFLLSCPDMLAALKNNVKRLYRAIQKNGDPKKELRLRLKWPVVRESELSAR